MSLVGIDPLQNLHKGPAAVPVQQAELAPCPKLLAFVVTLGAVGAGFFPCRGDLSPHRVAGQDFLESGVVIQVLGVLGRFHAGVGQSLVRLAGGSRLLPGPVLHRAGPQASRRACGVAAGRDTVKQGVVVTGDEGVNVKVGFASRSVRRVLRVSAPSGGSLFRCAPPVR